MDSNTTNRNERSGAFEHAWRWGVLASLIAIAAGLFTVSSEPANAQAGPRATSETRIAIVDIVRLFDDLDAFRAGQGEVDAIARELQEDVDAARERLVEAEDALKMAVDSNREEFLNRVLAAGIDLRGARANRELRIRLKQNQVLRSTWRSVSAGLADYARAAGYDAIVSNDSLLEPGIPIDADPETYKRFILDRHILHAGERIDITDEVITRMNNEFAARVQQDAGGR